MKCHLTHLLALAALLASPCALHAASLTLDGDWTFQLDPADAGVTNQWHARDLPGTIRLPGSLQAQGFGEEISVATRWLGLIRNSNWFDSPAYAKFRAPGNVKVPFWLQPERHYVGAAWYQRVVDIPADWAGRRVHLSLERVHISTRVWIDDRAVGSHDSLSTPHRFDLGPLTPGKHRLTIRVDNQPIPKIGVDSHCVTDHTQSAWNGLVGALTLETTPAHWIERVETYPDVLRRSVRVKWALGGDAAPARMRFTVHPPQGPPIQAEADATADETTLALGDTIATWDEFSPNLYRIESTLVLPNGDTHAHRSRFGMVEYRVDGRRFLVNGRPTLFRGTLDCAVFPLTGYPPTDVESWKREIAAVKAHGLNHIRFHSWCPPRAAFEAADELGCYLQIEHAWTAPANAGDYLMREGERVVREFGNHPSFAMHAYGNEPHGGNAWLTNWASHFKTRDPRRLHCASSGWPVTGNSDYHVLMDGLRVFPWGAGLKAAINRDAPATAADFGDKTRAHGEPLIAHESGQWCVYPDFDEIPKYTGFLKARNFELFRETLTTNHLGDQARDFLLASGRLQTICYKYEIEMLLRTPDLGGYQLLGLNDFPGQGTAPVGAVNVFWETKPYTTAAEYRSFSGSTVPLARLPKLLFQTNETLAAALEISHYAATPIPRAAPVWHVTDATGAVRVAGTLPSRDIPLGQSELGRIETPLASLPAPGQYRLTVAIPGATVTVSNSWDFWVYPSPSTQAPPAAITITRNPREAVTAANAGGTVLLIPGAADIVDPAGTPRPVLGFSTVFWNTAWTEGQPPTTLGILCNPRHPLLARFPTEFHSNFQWWPLIRRAPKPLLLDGQNPALRPVIQVIDDWFTNRRLGLVVEARCGSGRLLVSAIDFLADSAADPATAQFRDSVLAYMTSPAFAPRHELPPADLRRMLRLEP
jgi:hypothetical protein